MRARGRKHCTKTRMVTEIKTGVINLERKSLKMERKKGGGGGEEREREREREKERER